MNVVQGTTYEIALGHKLRSARAHVEGGLNGANKMSEPSIIRQIRVDGF
jgi:hypothetical protein